MIPHVPCILPAVNNLAAIGFGIPGEQELRAVLADVEARAQLEVWSDRHLTYVDASGAAIAFHIDKSGNIACITPHFVASSAPTRWIVRSSAGDGRRHLCALQWRGLRRARFGGRRACDSYRGAVGALRALSQVARRESRTYEIEVTGFAAAFDAGRLGGVVRSRAKAAMFGPHTSDRSPPRRGSPYASRSAHSFRWACSGPAQI